MLEASCGCRGQRRALRRYCHIGYLHYLAFDLELVKSVVRYCL
jgi:hypothetical protein